MIVHLGKKIETLTQPASMETKGYIQDLLYKHLDKVDDRDTDYIIFIQNQIIRLGVQPTKPNGKHMKYPLIRRTIHISIQPKLWKRYQLFLLTEWKYGIHPTEVLTALDSMIGRTHRKVGKLYTKVNRHYNKIREYKNSINNQ